jgi:hypothetical protein
MMGVEIQVSYSQNLMDVEQKFMVYFDSSSMIDSAIEMLKEVLRKATTHKMLSVTLLQVEAGERPTDYVRYARELNFNNGGGGWNILAGGFDGYYYDLKQVYHGTEIKVKRELINLLEQELRALKFQSEYMKVQ